MKKYSILLLIILSNLTALSQRHLSLDDDKIYIDSIEQIVKTTKFDSLKCLHSFRLSKLFTMTGDLKKAHFYLDNANKLCHQFKFLKDASTYYNTLDNLEKGDIAGFEKNLAKTNLDLKKYNITEAYRLRTIVLQNMGIMLQQKSKENEAMNLIVSEAIPLAKKSNDKELISAVYKAVGIMLMNTNERKKASYYLAEAQKNIENATKKSPTLIEFKVETYIMNAENLIELESYKEAKKSLDKAFLILNKYPKSNLYNNYLYVEGLYHSRLNQEEKAIIIFDKGIKNSNSHNDVLSLNRLQFAKYKSLFKLKRYLEAKTIIKSLVENSNFVIDKKNNYHELAKTYHKLGDSKNAYLFSEKYIILNDSINKSKYETEIVSLEAKFNKTENENKIKLLNAQKEKSELVAKNNRLNIWILGLTSVFLLVLAAFLWKFYQNQKKLTIQKEINFNQQINSLQDQQKLAVSNALLEGEELERKRLARDLHDGLGSMLSGLKLQLSKLNNSNESGVEEVNKQLDNSIKELRQIAQNMMPESLLKLGLNAALEDLCLRYTSSKIAIEFHSLGIENSISESQQIAIYRIVQELINNALKHANASSILVSCTQNNKRFFITVEDNGKGFDTKKENATINMGLKNIKNRVEFLNGKLEIDSEPENGTSFNIELNVA